MSKQRTKMRSENGQAIALLALLFVGLIAITALAVDGGRLYSERRTTQNGADNASLAGALAICNGENVSVKALASAAQNGFNNDGVTNTVTVSNPPVSGPYAGDNTYVEVVILSKQTPAFARLVYQGAFQTTSRAVAHCLEETASLGGGNGLIVLSPTDDQSLKGSGSSTITVGGGVFVNSNPSKALSLSGSAKVVSDTISIVGNYDVWGPGAVSPTPTTGVPPITDPLASVPEPTKPPGSCNNYSLSGGSATINPGLYCKITVSGGGQLTMNPGTYYVDTGDFSSSGGSSSISGNGVFIYVRVGKVTLSGGGSFNLSSPSSGAYMGMLFFMGRANSNDITISGGSSSSFTGTVYGPASTIKLSGGSGALTLNSQIIAWKAETSGSSAINVTYDPEGNFGGEGTNIIELSE